jgi:Domain of unknown function (DUF4062)
MIRTPDQRLHVFVSSALAELADERQAVATAVSALGLTPVMFESGARPHPPRDLYRAYLAQSDVFVGLSWQSYGRVSPGMQIMRNLSLILVAYARWAFAVGDPGRAAQLAGAAQGLRERVGLRPWPMLRRRELMTELREALRARPLRGGVLR